MTSSWAIARPLAWRCGLAAVLGLFAIGETQTNASGADSRGPIMCGGTEATVVGTAGDDEFGEEELRNGDVVAMLGGDDDALVEFSRNITFCGGSGRDSVRIEDAGGTITATGGPGRDRLGCYCSDDFVATAHFRLFGGSGQDRLPGGGFDDVIGGGPGDDLTYGLYGSDELSGDAGNDRVFGSQDNDTVRGGDGNDRVSGDYWRSEGQTSGWEPGGTDRAVGGAGFDSCRAETIRECEATF